MAERLFAFQDKPDNPAVTEIRDPAASDALKRTCAELGISVEVAPHFEPVPG
jgi:hypothetical protein